MTKQTRPPSTRKVRRDATGGKRADGHQRRRAIRRPDPSTIRKGPTDPSLTSVAGLVMFGVFLRGLGVDRALREAFAPLKSRDAIYPMAAQLRMLLDLFIVGEHRVFGLESLAADPLFVHLAGESGAFRSASCCSRKTRPTCCSSRRSARAGRGRGSPRRSP
jgi:hypothetical protein